VPVLTLAQVLAENNAPSAFEFLKIDVDGLEQAVLAVNDWLRFRPHVVMIEATLPETPVRQQDGCRALLTGVGWRHAWFDGLNDWYLAPEFDPPNGAFDAPPNIFDRYVTRRTVEAEAAVRSLVADDARLRARLADANADLAKHNKALSHVQNDLVLTRQEVADARAESNYFRELMRQSAASQQAESNHLRELMRQSAASQQAESNHLRELMKQAQAQSEALQMEVHALRTSTSWRLSAPIRVFGRIFRRR
jgi:hypothetical protein